MDFMGDETIMRKKSHISLARHIVATTDDAELKKHRFLFYIGSVLPDIKPSFLYKRHEMTSTFPAISKHIERLSEGEKVLKHKNRKYYLDLGQISHYLADYFTFPHNRTYPGSLKDHCSYEEKLNAFFEGKYQIMLGTQMVAKGFNFPNVTLVGVLLADQTLFSDDFRSYEKTFSLLTQVIGRSGRGENKGKAIIQTFSPEHSIINLAKEQNYEKFYNSEIQMRKVMLYPPFSNICIIGFVGKNEKTALRI